MPKPFVAVVNLSTVWRDVDIGAYVTGPLQTHVSRDLFAAWGVDADLGFYLDHTAIPPNDAWVVCIVDDSAHKDILGLHDLTKAGLPIGQVFAKLDLSCGEDPRRTLCHEVDEMLVNPHLDRYAFGSYQGKMVETIIEVADAVESVDLDCDGAPVSDFVTRAYFDPVANHPPGTKFDLAGKLTGPMTIAEGGYLSILDRTDGQGWHQVYGEHVPPQKMIFPPRGSRRERFFLRENHGRPWARGTLL